MATALDWLQPLLPGLVAVPAVQPGVCAYCRTAVHVPYDACWLCSGPQLADYPPVPVLPISLSVHGGLLHDHLRNYKDGLPRVRADRTMRLAALLETFLRYHLDSCLGGKVEHVATVASRRRDAPWAIVSKLRRFSGYSNVLRWQPNSDGSAGRLSANADVKGKRVLLLDDTFTSGRSIFGASKVLSDAGATVLGPLVIGRHVRPYYGASADLLKRLRKVTWDPTKCGRCHGVICVPPLRDPPTSTRIKL